MVLMAGEEYQEISSIMKNQEEDRTEQLSLSLLETFP